MRTVIAHGHIFKNAGTTFDWSLLQNFQADFLDHREDEIMRRKGAEHVRDLLTELPSLKALSSHHLCHPLPEIEDCTIRAVYFLRDPFARMESVYQFERRQMSNTPGARAAKTKSFEKYVRWRMQADVAPTIRNYQTLYLAGFHTRSIPRQVVGLPGFGRAMQNLRATPLVGIVERYDESMVVVEDLLKADFPAIDLSYVRQNTSRKSGSGSFDERIAGIMERLGDLQREVIDQNSLDLALYRLANSRLDEQVAAIADFDERLEAFRTRCANRQRARA